MFRAAAAAGLFLLVLAPLCIAYDNGLGRLPIMGWNTWCTDDACGLIDRCSDALVRSIADAMVEEGMVELGYEYVNMDDCWAAKTRNETGHMQPDAKRFPHGMKDLADYVHSKGLKFGLYTCVGTLTCKNGLPGSYGHFEQDAATFAEWGMDFVKADNCHRTGGFTEEQLYTNFSRALNATGHPMLFSVCEWGNETPERWGGNVAQMYRVQMDHIPFWHFPPKAAGVGFGQGTKDIIEYVATLKPSTFVKPFAILDPDFLETLFFPTMTFVESRTEFTFWSMWSAPLLVATDIRNMRKEKKEILMNEEAIAVDQDSMVVGGDRIANYSDGGQVWSKPLSNGDIAVVLYNPHDWQRLDIHVNWEMLGWSNSSSVAIRSIWDKKDLGSFTSGYSGHVHPHDVQFLRLRKQN